MEERGDENGLKGPVNELRSLLVMISLLFYFIFDFKSIDSSTGVDFLEIRGLYAFTGMGASPFYSN